MQKKARIISITKSEIEGMPDLSTEDLIIYVARVSNPSNQENTDTGLKLLRYLIAKKHWSPFDMADITIEIKTSRAIAAQILRHWSFDFQEFSQRYAEAVDLEPVQLREAGSTTRQGSKEGEFNPMLKGYTFPVLSEFMVKVDSQDARDVVDSFLELSTELYKSLLQAGVAKEVARMILPLTTQTTINMKSSVRNWLFYFSQRLDPHAQLEHRQIAAEMFEIFKSKFPTICEAFFGAETVIIPPIFPPDRIG